MSQPRDEPTRSPHAGPSDERVEVVMGQLLRLGVTLSALLVFTGGVLYLLHEGRQPAPDLRAFHKEPEELRSPVRILRESASLHSLGLILLGLLLLIATPVVRVLFSVVAFALQRDSLYVVFTLVVFVVLLYSLCIGYLAEH
jgi:uncharacterized membrane protein